ncbi:OpgC domain-containing protein [Trinickia dinghuensis]|uniref:OpgC domain-containing protein n=1 Tax=Trinickia dinghuensis TaxID=2291023 RepID=A0A3D8K0M0_9BURK|nr:OpgC domain-containing protein [Trinickia dinghuensis]RDU98632.1 OpgC domain-containing protein [Trinickia dinghuensis]
MQPSHARLLELDFFRGLVMLVIVVDHIGGSLLSRLTLHAYAFNDAADVFVFLGGYAAACAYLSLEARRGERAARQRFARRAGELYRGFLVTAALMLAISAVFAAARVDAPNLAARDLRDLIAMPAQTLWDVVSLRRQPYLASVLPMYVGFALATPLVVPLATRKPWPLLAASAAVWGAAGQAANWLPSVDQASWHFNPLAWQFVFVLGALARCQPFYQRIRAVRGASALSAAAIGIVLYLASIKLMGANDWRAFASKPDVGWLRVVNFVAIAWLAAEMTCRGWVGWLARKLGWINRIGRAGLVSFVAGAGISLVVDSILYALTGGRLHVPLGLVADAAAILALTAASHLHARPAPARMAAAAS